MLGSTTVVCCPPDKPLPLMIASSGRLKVPPISDEAVTLTGVMSAPLAIAKERPRKIAVGVCGALMFIGSSNKPIFRVRVDNEKG